MRINSQHGGTGLLLLGLCVLSYAGNAADSPNATPPNESSREKATDRLIVLDESAPNWVIEPFIGNRTAGGQSFVNGPALQTGGIGMPVKITFSPDGTAYMRIFGTGVVMVTPAGTARLVLNEVGNVDGPAELAAGGDVLWNTKDNSLYLSGPDCIRRLYTRSDGSRWVEVVAGVPNKPGHDDGAAKSATMSSANFVRLGKGEQGTSKGFCVTSKGVIYFSDNGIRKLENGIVSTITRAVPGFMAYDEVADIFYLKTSDPGPGGLGVDAFDPKTGKSTLVMGIAKPKGIKPGQRPDASSMEFRYNRNSDGPALTHASFNSNFMDCVWDPVHKALWVYGPDEDRYRWLKDGWCKTVMTTNALPNMSWTRVIAVDPKGQVYLIDGKNPTGVWRAHNTKESRP